jgi:tetratricopeptide (TPR) repeat protein
MSEWRTLRAKVPNIVDIKFCCLLAILMIPLSARADFTACTSARTKTGLDEQLTLYTRCIQNGDMPSGRLAFAFTARASVYLRKKELDLAMADLNRAIELAPRWTAPYMYRAQVFCLRRDYSASVADLTKVIEQGTARERAPAHGFRGTLLMSEAKCGPALADFDAALRIDKGNALVHASKAWVLATCDDTTVRDGQGALKAAQKALALRDYWESHQALSAAYAELGRFNESISEMEIAKRQAVQSGLVWRPELEEMLLAVRNGKPIRQPRDVAASLEATMTDREMSSSETESR